MKKIWKGLIMSTLMLLSSCGGQDGSSSAISSNNGGGEYNFDGGNTNVPGSHDVKGQIHQNKSTERDDYFFKNGASDYAMYLDADASLNLRSAVSDFVSLVYEATGYYLPIKDSSDADIGKNAKLICVGTNRLSEEVGVSVDYSLLRSQGYIIKTIGDAIYVNGFTHQAVANGLYEILRVMFGYDFYGPETYALNKKVTDVKMRDFDTLDAPDIEHRMGCYSFSTGSAATTRRYRISPSSMMPVNGATWHNTFNYLPKETYQDEHPLWYSDDGTQLCYLAHGNAAELAAMRNQVVEVMKTTIKENPDKTLITFTIQDSNTFCECEHCLASKEKYGGANSATVVQFLNPVSDAINEWFEGDGAEYKRDLKILFFAYLSTNQAPATYDASTDTYKAIDNSVICRDNVNVFFADIRGDYTSSYYDTEGANAPYIKAMKAWTALSKNFFFWTYQTNFAYYLVPYNCFNAMQESYRFAVSCNALYIFDEGQWNQGNACTGWSFLKQYLTDKETWDVSVNQSDLIAKFFSGFYDDAGGIMKQIFDEWLVLATYQNELGYKGANSIYYNALQEQMWPKGTLSRWLDLFDDALEKISYLEESSPTTYKRIKNHITAERVAYEYIMLSLYNSSMSEGDYKALANQFHQDAKDNGMNYTKETGTLISDVFVV